MVVQIQVRRDTAANWTSNDPTLAEGEMGLETDTTFFKFGDGSTAWTSLPYVQDGLGIPAGGTTGQRLAKASNTDYDTEWVTAAAATIDLTGDTGSASSIGDVTFEGTGGIATTVTDDGGGAGTVTIDGSGISSGGGGALVLLEQHTASSSATLDFTTAISSTYDQYVIELLHVIPATDNVFFYMRCSTDGGSSYDSTGIYDVMSFYTSTSGSAAAAGTTGADLTAFRIADGVGNDAGWGVTGTIKLTSPLDTASYKTVVGDGAWLYFGESTHPYRFGFAAAYRNLSAVNAIRFLFASGNIASGTIRVYGIAKA